MLPLVSDLGLFAASEDLLFIWYLYPCPSTIFPCKHTHFKFAGNDELDMIQHVFLDLSYNPFSVWEVLKCAIPIIPIDRKKAVVLLIGLEWGEKELFSSSSLGSNIRFATGFLYSLVPAVTGCMAENKTIFKRDNLFRILLSKCRVMHAMITSLSLACLLLNRFITYRIPVSVSSAPVGSSQVQSRDYYSTLLQSPLRCIYQ